jgi:hypothetical protein
VDFSWFSREFFQANFSVVTYNGVAAVLSVTGAGQPVTRGQHFATRHSVVLSAEAFEIRILLLAVSLTILKKKNENHLCLQVCVRLLIYFVKLL